MFVDVSGSTALYRAAGNERAEALVRTALNRLRATTTKLGGRVVKTIGDELMCRFDSAPVAAAAAIEMQRQAQTPLDVEGAKLGLRAGFAYGPVLEREGDVFGDVVNVAARLCAMAKADQILTTEPTAARLDAEQKANTRLFDKTPVKGIREEIVVVQLLWERRNTTLLVPIGAVEAVNAAELELRCRDQTWNFVPEDLPVWIGRAEDCHLVIPSACASRRHARLEYRRGKFTLVDESSNGTYVELSDGDTRRVIYLRNEAFALVGSGRFALGTPPDADPQVLSYQSLPL